MKIDKKIVLYFGLGGILPVIYFSIEGVYNGYYDPTTSDFFLQILINLGISYFMTTSVSLLVLFSVEAVDKFFPWSKNVWKRFMADVLITPTIAVIGVLPLAWITYFIYKEHDTLETHMIKNVVMALVLDLILVAIYEGVYFFKQWKSSLLRTEMLEKENMASRFEALKDQINPHFLFNSLNTLSSLVHEDANKAEAFIEEFAKIYRYVLEHQDKTILSLSCELRFVESYMYLQKIRFGDALAIELDIDENEQELKVPTLSLQLLIENAIKHNKVTKADPLLIKIHIHEDYLFVENNLQLRENRNSSVGIGQKNLIERYSLITHRTPSFHSTDSSYIAKIPLLIPDTEYAT